MATTSSGNPHGDPPRTQDGTPGPSAGRMDKFGGLDPAAFSPQPVPAEVQAPPDDKDLTDEAEECQNPVEMPAKEARPGRTDPALQEAFDAFDGAKLPRPELTKLTGLTPAEGLETLRALVKYLDDAGDPVVKVVQLVLADLRGQSFDSLAGTKEWATLVQWLADRTGYVIECPKCNEPARLDTASHRSAASGSIRYRHSAATHGGSGTLPDPSLRRMDRPE